MAVTRLSIEIRRTSRAGFTPRHAVTIEQLRPAITELLSAIPATIALHDLSEDDFARWLGPGSPADRLWTLLRTAVGIPQVATFKLLARKRPRLLPIRDSVVAGVLGDPDQWWELWWRTLQNHTEIVEQLRAVRDAAGADELSLLRVADIVIWARNHVG